LDVLLNLTKYVEPTKENHAEFVLRLKTYKKIGTHTSYPAINVAKLIPFNAPKIIEAANNTLILFPKEPNVEGIFYYGLVTLMLIANTEDNFFKMLIKNKCINYT